MALDALEEPAEEWRQGEGEDRNSDHCEDDPE
jgi:hypothetical protein